MFTVILPWFPRELSTNGQHGHWAPRAKATRTYRGECAWQCLQQGTRGVDWPNVDVHIVFVPPNKRRRDAANCLASFKAGIDGIADALGVDDSRFRITFEMATDIGGFVRVTAREAACNSQK